MSSPAPPKEVFSGAIDKMKKDRLQALSVALGLALKTDGRLNTKDVLLANIEALLFASQAVNNPLREDTQFAQLYEHREAQNKSGKGKKSKTSADKTAEDGVEQAKTPQALTPANAKLLAGKVTTDPPAAFKQLGLRAISQPKKNQGNATTVGAFAGRISPISPITESDDRESPAPGSAAGKDSEKEDKDESEDENAKVKSLTTKETILVKFSDPTDKSHPASETFVHGLPIKHTITASGSKYETDLRSLVPAALNNLSPMKNNPYGRIARPGFSIGAGKMHIGKVGELLSKDQVPGGLDYERVYTMALKKENDDFVCDLFYESPTALGTAAAGGSSSTRPVTSLTGAGSDRPLDIAKHRAAAAIPLKVADKNSPPEFYQLLLLIVGSEKLTPRTNLTGEDAVASYREFEPFFQKFAKYRKPHKGYLLPSDYEATPDIAAAVPNWRDFVNTVYTKEDLIRVGGLGKTATNEVHSLIGQGLKLSSDLGTYLNMGHRTDVEKPEGITDLEAEYGEMSYKDFKQALKDEIGERKLQKAPKKSGSKSKAGHSKSKRGRDEEAAAAISEGEQPAKKKKSNAKEIKRLEKQLEQLKGKAKAVDSDDLDG
ncbi:hypothetical protein B0H16DRAFT_1780833 [Mycena metata]|uniref:Uncharacterized protein n=1 Tax=Mycena metata TaxID=1033252 RepID=A0AAD7JNU0_9AGAR|nr:hypothetical protein B0H16DRAFT_1780833 [Mycena metata]